MRTRLLALLLGTCAIVAQETSPDGTAEIAPEDRAIFAKAFALEDAREWSKARAIYEEILLRQPDHAQAREGKTRATKVIAAEFQLEECIAEAERQTAAGNFQAAIRAFNQAMTVKPDYVSKDRFQALRATLMEQNTPVELTLKSDGSTWVLIENYRPPMKLLRETFKILPGNYRVVGRRSGYQDIARDLVVRSGAVLVLDVVCRVQSPPEALESEQNERLRFERDYQRALNARRMEESRAKQQFEDGLRIIPHD
jgi:tetratricopeptide (TPR) repeat protein